MIIFDYFFYVIYHFLNRRLRRSKEDAKHSALCIALVYISLFILTVALSIGLIKNNSISLWFSDNFIFVWMIVGIFGYIYFRIRYYKIYDIEDIEKKIIQLPYKGQQISKYFYYILLIGIPVLWFILFRLYTFGHI
jgi:hypothetical protein